MRCLGSPQGILCFLIQVIAGLSLDVCMSMSISAVQCKLINVLTFEIQI